MLELNSNGWRFWNSSPKNKLDLDVLTAGSRYVKCQTTVTRWSELKVIFIFKLRVLDILCSRSNIVWFVC